MLKGKSQKAHAAYELAMQAFREAKFIHLEALANELLARFYLFDRSLYNQDRAQNYLRRARKLYADWGAEFLANRVANELATLVQKIDTKIAQQHIALSSPDQEQLALARPELIGRKRSTDPTGLRPVSPSDETVLKSGSISHFLLPYYSQGLSPAEVQLMTGVAQCFASEINAQELLKTAFRLLLTCANATRGFLVFQYSNQGLYVEAAGETAGKHKFNVSVLQALPLKRSNNETLRDGRRAARAKQGLKEEESGSAPYPVPLNVIEFVQSNKMPVVLEAETGASMELDPAFVTDPYLIEQQPKSVLCVPIVVRNESSAVLYFENTKTSASFNKLNLLVLNNVASQLILFIEHYRLNSRLLQLKKGTGRRHPNADRVIRSGWLNKLSESLFWNSWNQVWVVMTRAEIHFYKTNHTQGKTPQSSIAFDQVKQVRVLSADDSPGLVRPRTGTVFVIKYAGTPNDNDPGFPGDQDRLDRSAGNDRQVYLAAMDRSVAGVWFSTLTKLVAEAQPVATRPDWEATISGSGGSQVTSTSSSSKSGNKPADITLKSEDIRIRRLLGSGASAEVHQGVWNGLTVAVKKLREHSSEAEIKELMKELNLLAGLRHPNIVQFLGVYMEEMIPHEGSRVVSYAPCIVTEFMERGSLFHVLHLRKHDLPLQIKWQIAYQSAQGMTYLHSKNPPIIHRDLKSLNILISQDYNAKICDFGLARAMPQQSAAFMTARLGTSLWMSPEVFTSSSYSPLTDVFSFGIVLWEIWTRQEPYADLPTTVDIPHEVCHRNLRPTIPPNCHQRWADLMKICWHADPSNRPSFKSIVVYLNKFEAEMTTAPGGTKKKTRG